jgi:hypothetical protein
MGLTAIEAGRALETIATRLLENSIIQQEGYSVIHRVVAELKTLKGSLSWKFEIDRGNPILFMKAVDKAGRSVTPFIEAGGIHVEQTDGNLPPFKALDMAFQVNDDINGPISRWHLDVANQKEDGAWQSGPLVHLQYGGHYHDQRDLDHPLKAPRWCHPPMEIGLLCEVVAANFFETEWANFREDPNWCQSISVFQKLCYTHYAEKLTSSLSVSSSTALSAMWAGSWL